MAIFVAITGFLFIPILSSRVLNKVIGNRPSYPVIDMITVMRLSRQEGN